MSPVFKVLSAAKRDMNRGFWHAIGMAPESFDDVAGDMWTYGTKRWRTGVMAAPEPQKGNVPLTLGSAAGMGVGLAGTVATLADGYSQAGVFGAATALAADVGTNAAVVRFGYGRGIKNANVLSIAARSLTGMGASWAVRAALGGGLFSLAPALAAGYAGGAVPPAVTGAALTAGAAAAVGVGVFKAGRAVARQGYQYKQTQKQVQTSGSLAAFHTQGAHTMRARAVQAIHKSHLNARSALGHEAQFMHFPSKNYHSRYRMV